MCLKCSFNPNTTVPLRHTLYEQMHKSSAETQTRTHLWISFCLSPFHGERERNPCLTFLLIIYPFPAVLVSVLDHETCCHEHTRGQ
ncbi:uncharacterized protein K489DRAFT_88112 [Dissoconium aciculare CBS 342.82]|uniref:Uncharacterized protein n=1 Tax=Dissoconium aciculare CBS 342.82 TaxID=1314786 RepID=A0A6J3LTS1_9PEZI|nr:uncharacterized protein K489DRAFT_88112 [Dissoconium aciculare CBS 342.82]KAF1818674.1 hypothetical protein K489DRAFT_88112 [Dissoconium aciculare CBS 342.82]